ncbi:MAG: T9SS type A sorting domain-containing protein [Bacteroidetes bacterium]|nr:T9SS type A sorting domain-containing protein [Bacteroidota bacterium]
METNTGIAANYQKRESTNINVYPNPANDLLNIIYTGYQSIQSYSIFNLIGQEVMSGVINQNKTALNIENLPTGMYILKLMNKAEESTIKFVKE